MLLQASILAGFGGRRARGFTQQLNGTLKRHIGFAMPCRKDQTLSVGVSASASAGSRCDDEVQIEEKQVDQLDFRSRQYIGT